MVSWYDVVSLLFTATLCIHPLISILISGAATDTNATVMSWWMFAMVLHPEAQRRGQAEVDAVVGRDRLPTFADFNKLPFVRCIVSAPSYGCWPIRF